MDRLRIGQAETAQEIADVQALMREYIDWAVTLGKDDQKAPTFHDADQEIAGLPGIYVPPAGRLLVAYDGNQAAGCIALKPLDNGICELKRLYVRPAHRGKGIGQQLVEHLMRAARASGYRKVILDSRNTMTSAHAIYRAIGFKEVAGPPDFPEWLRPVVIFMEADL